MHQIKNLIKKYFSNFVYFYKYLRYRIFVSIGLSIAVSSLDAFGLSMFLPLLQMVSNASEIDSNAMGNLGFLITSIESTGIKFNLEFVLLFMLLFFIFKGIAVYLSMVYYTILRQLFVKKIRINLLNALNQITFKSFVSSNA